MSRPDAEAVYAAATRQDTAVGLYRKLGVQVERGESVVLQWLQKCRDVPFEAYEVEDLVIALSNGVHVPMVLPLAFEALERDLEAGLLYEGQLVHAAAEACHMVRPRRPDFSRRLLQLLERTRAQAPATVHELIDRVMAELRQAT